MANKNITTEYGFGQMGSVLITGTTNDVTIIGGTSGSTTTTQKVFVAIQFLEDTVFDNDGLKSEDNTLYVNSDTAQTSIDANGTATTDSVTFPKGMTIYGRWTSILLDSGSCIAYVGY